MGKSKGGEHYAKELERVHGDRLTIKNITDFKSSKVKVTIVCKDHGDFEADVKSLLRIRNGITPKGCPECARISRATNLCKSEPDYLQSITEEGYTWLEEYKGNNKSFHKLRHDKCGIIRNVRPNDFQQGYSRCKCKVTAEARVSSKLSTRLYVCELFNTDTNEKFIKIGIKSGNRARNFEVYDSTVVYEYEYGYVSKSLEKFMHYKYKKNSYTPKLSFAGFTECFDLSIKDEVLKFLKEQEQ